MTISIDNPDFAIRIQRVIDRILEQNALIQEPRFHQENFLVFTAEKINQFIVDEMGFLQHLLKDGFAIIKPNMPTIPIGQKKNLIILSECNIENGNLTDEEICGVISHELGHLFNKPILTDESKERYAAKNEYYADAFAKKLGFGEGLIRSLEKYLVLPIAKNKDLINERITKLGADESYIDGAVIPNLA